MTYGNGLGEMFSSSETAFELAASSSQRRRSTTELRAHRLQELLGVSVLMFAYLALTLFHSRIMERKFKEVIYPQVPLRIPCYDLAPLMTN